MKKGKNEKDEDFLKKHALIIQKAVEMQLEFFQ